MTDTGSISDGYHTFDELYEHRNLLFINLCRILYDEWCTDCFWNRNGDYEGYFCLYKDDDHGQISYHMQDKYLPLLGDLPYKECEWDGHTSQDVINRLKESIK